MMLGEEVVILHLGQSSYYGLNQTGARVWNWFRDGLTIGQVIDSLETKYEVGRSDAEEDVRKLLDDLVKRGLVQVVL